MVEIEEGEKSPYLLINETENKFVMKGNSFMANPPSFYQEILDWSNSFRVKESAIFKIEITVGFYNTSTLKIMNMILRNIASNNPDKIKAKFFLEEEDDDLKDTSDTISFNIGITPEIEYYS